MGKYFSSPRREIKYCKCIIYLRNLSGNRYLEDQECDDRNTGRLLEISQDHIQKQTLILLVFNVCGPG
jgi:hypothetical protein